MACPCRTDAAIPAPRSRRRVLGLRRLVDDADEVAPDAVDFPAAQARLRVRDFVGTVVVATDVGERRPPLFRTRRLGESAYIAPEFHPNGFLARAVRARLDEPRRRVAFDLSELGLGQLRRNAVPVRHL